MITIIFIIVIISISTFIILLPIIIILVAINIMAPPLAYVSFYYLNFILHSDHNDVPTCLLCKKRNKRKPQQNWSNYSLFCYDKEDTRHKNYTVSAENKVLLNYSIDR